MNLRCIRNIDYAITTPMLVPTVTDISNLSFSSAKFHAIFKRSTIFPLLNLHPDKGCLDRPPSHTHGNNYIFCILKFFRLLLWLCFHVVKLQLEHFQNGTRLRVTHLSLVLLVYFCIHIMPVSYTHLTLPTKRIV